MKNLFLQIQFSAYDSLLCIYNSVLAYANNYYSRICGRNLFTLSPELFILKTDARLPCEVVCFDSPALRPAGRFCFIFLFCCVGLIHAFCWLVLHQIIQPNASSWIQHVFVLSLRFAFCLYEPRLNVLVVLE